MLEPSIPAPKIIAVAICHDKVGESVELQCKLHMEQVKA